MHSRIIDVGIAGSVSRDIRKKGLRAADARAPAGRDQLTRQSETAMIDPHMAGRSSRAIPTVTAYRRMPDRTMIGGSQPRRIAWSGIGLLLGVQP